MKRKFTFLSKFISALNWSFDNRTCGTIVVCSICGSTKVKHTQGSLKDNVYTSQYECLDCGSIAFNKEIWTDYSNRNGHVFSVRPTNSPPPSGPPAQSLNPVDAYVKTLMPISDFTVLKKGDKIFNRHSNRVEFVDTFDHIETYDNDNDKSRRIIFYYNKYGELWNGEIVPGDWYFV